MRTPQLLTLAVVLSLACTRDLTSPRAPAVSSPSFFIDPNTFKVPVKAFDPVAALSASGRRVALAGPIQCEPAGQRGQFRVALTQAATGAEGFALFTVTCTGELGTWDALGHTTSPAGFAPGAATACAALTSAYHRAEGDAAWCRKITLVAD